MKLRKILKFFLGLLMLIAVVIGLTSINHPIILKWVSGSARHYGKPMSAKVYMDGQLNESIKVFYSDDPNNYLLSLKGDDSLGKLEFLNINVKEKWIGRPVGNSKNDYDMIGGHLFLSKAGGQFTPFQDNTNGSNFDPQLSFTKKQIKFILPPAYLNFDSLRIELP